MIIGLIGLANAGKTVLFNALTGAEAPVTAYANRGVEPNLASVPVRDERVDRLVEMYRPRKVTYASVDFIDFAGLSEGDARGGVFSGLAMGLVKNTDALAVVLRNFEDDLSGPPDPEGDLELLETELLLSDLLITERRLERIRSLRGKGKGNPALEAEEKLLRRAAEALEGNRPLRALGLSAEEKQALKGFHFLTLKPALVVLNSGEERYGKSPGLLERLQERYPAVEFAGRFEMELARLEDEEERRLFLEDMGIGASARDRLVRLAYETVGYISFFTVGPDEVRAWTLLRGGTAEEAAGVIHRDLARGFIRAECFSCEELLACGSEKEVRARGLLRLEGRKYAVKDGDVLCIRFSV